MDGILLIDKPKGWTSFDVVAKVRSALRKAQSPKPKAQSQNVSAHSSQPSALSPKVKVGHTGTLDPLATGLLVILIGNYTKKAPELTKLDKTYEVTMKLGQTSTTGDEEGEKYTVNSIQPTVEEFQTIFEQFTGAIDQVPPTYSAIKVNGQRAYKLARQGKEVKLGPREVTIYSIQLTDYSYPLVKLTAEVSSGTYIRSLVEDIGNKLGTGAYMSDLRRTKVGDFLIDTSINIDGIDCLTIQKKLIYLKLPMYN